MVGSVRLQADRDDGPAKSLHDDSQQALMPALPIAIGSALFN